MTNIFNQKYVNIALIISVAFIAYLFLDFSVSPNFLLSNAKSLKGKDAYIALIHKDLLNFVYLIAIVGICTFLGFFALIQSQFTTDRATFYWSFYLFSNAIFFFIGLDHNFQLNLFSGALHLEPRMIQRPWAIPSQYLVCFAYLSFMCSFLELKKIDFKLFKFVNYVRVVLVYFIIQSFYDVYRLKYTPFIDTGILLILVVLIVIISQLFKYKSLSVKLFLTGTFSVLVMGVIAGIVDFFSTTSHVSFFKVPFNIISFGILLELMFFLLALSQKSLSLEKEKRYLQKKYLETLEEEVTKATDQIASQNKKIEAQKIQKIKSEYELKIAEVKIDALRSQMNPHFIFNCLNSIKLYTLENDAKSASEYITKFSKLIRKVLDNSRSTKVLLSSELETIGLYIEMETMRFKEKLSYSIFIEKTLETNLIEIPPLVLQPYIENAIWHGLMHRETGGKVVLSISQPSKDLLMVIIEDNGVGREKSLELQSKSATKSKSFGMKVTSERLELINQMYKTNTTVNIEDLISKDGEAAGTKIILNIPI